MDFVKVMEDDSSVLVVWNFIDGIPRTRMQRMAISYFGGHYGMGFGFVNRVYYIPLSNGTMDLVSPYFEKLNGFIENNPNRNFHIFGHGMEMVLEYGDLLSLVNKNKNVFIYDD